MNDENVSRCWWCGTDELYVKYHDEEWGVAVHDDQTHFEFLILEGVQAGLSWITILKKRENYRLAYEGFDPERVAAFSDEKLASFLLNKGLIRNKLKVAASRTNARAFLEVQREFGTFDKYIWQFAGGKPIVNAWETKEQVPATSPESDVLSKDLKKRGFKFVGSTIIYAHMQAIGMVNDHLTSCFRYEEVQRLPGH